MYPHHFPSPSSWLNQFFFFLEGKCKGQVSFWLIPAPTTSFLSKDNVALDLPSHPKRLQDQGGVGVGGRKGQLCFFLWYLLPLPHQERCHLWPHCPSQDNTDQPHCSPPSHAWTLQANCEGGGVRGKCLFMIPTPTASPRQGCCRLGPPCRSQEATGPVSQQSTISCMRSRGWLWVIRNWKLAAKAKMVVQKIQSPKKNQLRRRQNGTSWHDKYVLLTSQQLQCI